MTISLVALDEFKSHLFMLLRIIPHSNDTSFSQKYGWREVMGSQPTKCVCNLSIKKSEVYLLFWHAR